MGGAQRCLCITVAAISAILQRCIDVFQALQVKRQWGALNFKPTASFSVVNLHFIVSVSRDGILRISWDAVVGASYYRVYHNTTNDKNTATAITEWQAELLAEHNKAQPGANYYWIVGAIQASGEKQGVFSPSKQIIRTVSLTAPENVKARLGESKEMVIITWDRVDGASFYQVYRGTDDDPAGAVPIGDWRQDVSGYEDKTGDPDRIYYYWVKAAVSNAGASASEFSRPAQGFRAGPLLPPRNLKAEPEARTITLTWEANDEATVVRYRIYVGTSSNASTLLDSVDGRNNTSQIISSLISDLPDEVNFRTLGCDINCTRDDIKSRFTEVVGREPSEEELDELFRGKTFTKAELSGLVPGQVYHFRITAVDDNFFESQFSQEVNAMITQAASKLVKLEGRYLDGRPLSSQILGNFPNPFNTSTNIRLRVSEPTRVKINIYNVKGQLTRRLVDRSFGSGIFQVSWDGRDDHDIAVGSGIYVFTAQFGRSIDRKSLVLVK